MVRTLEGGVRASGGKAPRKGLSAHTSSVSLGDKSKPNSSVGGNPICPRETPAWQKPITQFFNTNIIKKTNPPNENEQSLSKDITEQMDVSNDNLSTDENKENINEEKKTLTNESDGNEQGTSSKSEKKDISRSNGKKDKKEKSDNESSDDETEIKHVSKKMRIIDDDSD